MGMLRIQLFGWKMGRGWWWKVISTSFCDNPWSQDKLHSVPLWYVKRVFVTQEMGSFLILSPEEIADCDWIFCWIPYLFFLIPNLFCFFMCFYFFLIPHPHSRDMHGPASAAQRERGWHVFQSAFALNGGSSISSPMEPKAGLPNTFLFEVCHVWVCDCAAGTWGRRERCARDAREAAARTWRSSQCGGLWVCQEPVPTTVQPLFEAADGAVDWFLCFCGDLHHARGLLRLHGHLQPRHEQLEQLYVGLPRVHCHRTLWMVCLGRLGVQQAYQQDHLHEARALGPWNLPRLAHPLPQRPLDVGGGTLQKRRQSRQSQHLGALCQGEGGASPTRPFRRCSATRGGSCGGGCWRPARTTASASWGPKVLRPMRHKTK